MDYSQIRAEAERLLEILYVTPFEDCCPLTKQFSHLMVRPGLYAIRHRVDGILTQVATYKNCDLPDSHFGKFIRQNAVLG